MNAFILIFSLTLIPTTSLASPLTFRDTWKLALEQSSEIAALRHQATASRLSLSRAKTHWLPQLGLRAQAITTNDPGANLFGALSQRSITALDFTPSTLNRPGFNQFQTATLGLDLPLFEGGAGVETVSAQTAELESRELAVRQKARALFGEVLTLYGSLVADQASRVRLLSLREQVRKILSRYSIGVESNPVGYSGMLGLRGLENRIEAELIGMETSIRSDQITLAAKTSLSPEALSPAEKEIKEILDALPAALQKPLMQTHQSLDEEAARKREEALLASENAEKSRFLPRIGLFGNETLVHGSRDTGFATTAGLYLSWSLFTPENKNRVAEQEALRNAAEKQREFAAVESQSGRDQLNQSESALERASAILSGSDRILDEQVRVASRLFQSGSISALQLSEVYNRRADLILEIRRTHRNRIAIHGKKALYLQEIEELP